jgi:hypothetical protein
MRNIGVVVLVLALTACNRAEQKEALPAYFDPFADVKRTMNEATPSGPTAAASAPAAAPKTGP